MRRKSAAKSTDWVRRQDYPKDIGEEFHKYPMVTAKELRHLRERPRQVRMLTRDFIDGRL